MCMCMCGVRASFRVPRMENTQFYWLSSWEYLNVLYTWLVVRAEVIILWYHTHTQNIQRIVEFAQFGTKGA